MPAKLFETDQDLPRRKKVATPSLQDNGLRGLAQGLGTPRLGSAGVRGGPKVPSPLADTGGGGGADVVTEEPAAEEPAAEEPSVVDFEKNAEARYQEALQYYTARYKDVNDEVKAALRSAARNASMNKLTIIEIAEFVADFFKVRVSAGEIAAGAAGRSSDILRQLPGQTWNSKYGRWEGKPGWDSTGPYKTGNVAIDSANDWYRAQYDMLIGPDPDSAEVKDFAELDAKYRQRLIEAGILEGGPPQRGATGKREDMAKGLTGGVPESPEAAFHKTVYSQILTIIDEATARRVLAAPVPDESDLVFMAPQMVVDQRTGEQKVVSGWFDPVTGEKVTDPARIKGAQAAKRARELWEINTDEASAFLREAGLGRTAESKKGAPGAPEAQTVEFSAFLEAINAASGDAGQQVANLQARLGNLRLSVESAISLGNFTQAIAARREERKLQDESRKLDRLQLFLTIITALASRPELGLALSQSGVLAQLSEMMGIDLSQINLTPQRAPGGTQRARIQAF